MHLVNKEEREYVRALHSCADDLTYFASSVRHDHAYQDGARAILERLEAIPTNERAERNALEPLVRDLISVAYPEASESLESLVAQRPAKARAFQAKLHEIYPPKFDFEPDQIIRRQSY